MLYYNNMEDNSYNRHILDELKRINRRFVNSETAKGYMVNERDVAPATYGVKIGNADWDTTTALMTSKDLESKDLEGGNIFGDLISGVGSIFGLGKGEMGDVMEMEGGKKKRGRKAKKGKKGKKGGMMMGGELDPLEAPASADLEGEGFLGDLVSGVGSIFGLGKKKRGRPAKAKAGGAVMSGGKKKVGRPAKTKAGGALVSGGAGYNNVNPFAGVNPELMVASGNKKGGALMSGGLYARGIGAGRGNMEGGNFFDDVLGGITKVADTATHFLPLIAGLGKPAKAKKGGALVSGGAVMSGGKRKLPAGAKLWVNFVKKLSEKSGLNYSEVLKDPKTKMLYKKYKESM